MHWRCCGLRLGLIHAMSLQLCTTLCDPMDCSPLGSSVHEILQERILEWLPFLSPGDLPNPGIKPASPALEGGFFTTEPPRNPINVIDI